jgi:methionyl-tRNA synthetase
VHATAGNFDNYITEVSDLIAELNRYWSLIQPWNFANQTDKESKEKMKTILYMSFEGIRIAALLLQPIMPDKTSQLLETLQIPTEQRFFWNAQLDSAPSNRRIGPMKPLFPKIDEFK